ITLYISLFDGELTAMTPPVGCLFIQMVISFAVQTLISSRFVSQFVDLFSELLNFPENPYLC
ncbi:hypothetical protein ACQP3C_31340, partial [Escherichia coli]